MEKEILLKKCRRCVYHKTCEIRQDTKEGRKICKERRAIIFGFDDLTENDINNLIFYCYNWECDLLKAKRQRAIPEEEKSIRIKMLDEKLIDVRLMKMKLNALKNIINPKINGKIILPC